MQSKLLHEAEQRTFVLVYDLGDEVIAGLREFAARTNLRASSFTAIGAFHSVTLGYFDWTKKDYDRIRINEQVEVLALVGNIARKGNEPKIHAHVVLGKRDGTAHGGHLLEARVRPTLEVVITESPAFLVREVDEETGLPLILIQ
jgi:predicted DNA-binding protein with PD1-like motif